MDEHQPAQSRGAPLRRQFAVLRHANARLQQGNQPLLDDDGLCEIEKLNNRIRLHPLGPIPAIGEVSYPAVVGATTAPGWMRVFQALEIDTPTNTLLQRTNSIFVVVH